MQEFVSEAIMPGGAAFDTSAMARGEPGLPGAFVWRGDAYEVVETLERWKASGPEVGRLHGERYLRRHYWRLRMSDGAVWTVYFVRHTPSGGSKKSAVVSLFDRASGPAGRRRTVVIADISSTYDRSALRGGHRRVSEILGKGALYPGAIVVGSSIEGSEEA